jgi:type VI protein secretion system component Hcp
MSHLQLAPNIYDCSSCQTRCDGKSIGVYDFEKDVNFSEAIEEQIIKQINKSNPNLFAFKTKKNGYPDIEIISKTSIDKPVCYIEIKVQSRTFMSIERILPNSNLKPSETIALNLSDLERYFEIHEKEKTDLYIVWCLKNRNCINNQNTDLYFHQNIIELKKIRMKDTTNFRKFKRATGIGDVVNGQHKGVLVNYHFSLNELIQGIPTIPNQ